MVASPGPLDELRPGRFARLPCSCCPGDSPLGLRLPLDSLPWTPPSHGRSSRPIPSPLGLRAAGTVQLRIPARAQPESPVTARGGIEPRATAAERSRPAPHGTSPCHSHGPLCRAARRGRCTSSCRPPNDWRTTWIWSPRSKDTPRRRKRRWCSKAISPPHDHRVHNIKVTPDPGVIEVNTQPAARLGRTGRDHDGPLRRGALSRLGTEKVRPRRPAHRHRRRQPRGARRPHARRTARSCGAPTCCGA